MQPQIGRSHARLMSGMMRGMLALSLTGCVTIAAAQDKKSGPAPHDAITDAQTPKMGASVRPEQRKTDHDRSGIFEAEKARPSSPVFTEQPRDGKMLGFDFSRDPLGSEKPLQEPDEIMKKDIAAKAKVMEAQRKFLERRYQLDPKLDSHATMSRESPCQWVPRLACRKA